MLQASLSSVDMRVFSLFIGKANWLASDSHLITSPTATISIPAPYKKGSYMIDKQLTHCKTHLFPQLAVRCLLELGVAADGTTDPAAREAFLRQMLPGHSAAWVLLLLHEALAAAAAPRHRRRRLAALSGMLSLLGGRVAEPALCRCVATRPARM